MKKRKGIRRGLAVILAAALVLAACGRKDTYQGNLATEEEKPERVVLLFTPMEKSNPDNENIARTAHDKTVALAEERLGVAVEYRTYTAEDYKERTYDEVLVDRARNNMDDFYLMNPDSIRLLGEEGVLADLSGLDAAKNLRDVVKTANTVNGKLVAIPQEVVAYGLFINRDLFDKYHLDPPETPDEFLECCRVFKENGFETPVGANRWWLETFVFAMGFADLYNGDSTEAEVEAINSGKARLSDYMRPGFEFLQELIDKGYIDPETAYRSEAIEGEGPDFLAQKTPIVMAYWGAANADTAYGKADFNMEVIGFPSSRGPMPVVNITGFGVGAQAEHLDDTLKVLEVLLSDEALQIYAETNKVISPSKNVEVECIDALKPLNDRVNEGVYVLASNASLEVEQWGNVCLVVRDLLAGATVDECMARFDRMQAEAIEK